MITQIPLNYCSPTPSLSLLYSPSKTPTRISPHPLFPLHYNLNAHYAKEKHRAGLSGVILIYDHSNCTLGLSWQPPLLVPNLLLSHFTEKLFLCYPSSSVPCSPSLTPSQQITVTFNSLWQERLLKEKKYHFLTKNLTSPLFSFWPNRMNCPESLAKVSSFTECWVPVSSSPLPSHPYCPVMSSAAKLIPIFSMSSSTGHT